MSYEIEKLLENSDFLAPDPKTGRFPLAYTTLFKDLQSNILTPAGRGCARYFFVRFTSDPAHKDELRQFLGTLAGNHFERLMFDAGIAAAKADGNRSHPLAPRLEALLERRASKPAKAKKAYTEGVAAAQKRAVEEVKNQNDVLRKFRIASEHEVYWRRAAERPPADADEALLDAGAHERAVKPAPVAQPARLEYELNVLLSSSGYAKIGEEPPPDPAFREGMRERGPKRLNDVTTDWDHDFQGGADALFIVMYDDAGAPGRAAQEQDLSNFQSLLEQHAASPKDVWCESGRQLKATHQHPNGTQASYPIEPFGFRDTISQPIFYKDEYTRRSAAANRAQFWDPFAPLRLALAPDPGGVLRYSCGSYLVFRKLEQHIETFYEQSEALARARGRNASDLRAEFVGRKPDGTPLVAGNGLNDFDYGADTRGDVCPFHAHTRKSNPRGDVRGHYGTRERRIVRRGIPYGPEIKRAADGTPVMVKGRIEYLNAPDDEKKKSIGLLFLCAQSDIAGQFESIQMLWQNQANHPVGHWPGADTVSGQLLPGASNMIGIGYETNGQRYSKGNDADYRPVVTVKGGDYFFAPSISFLRRLLESLWQ